MNCSHECAGKFCTNCGASLLKMEEIRSIEDSLKATNRKGDLVGNWVCDLRAYRSLEGMLSYRYTFALNPPKFVEV